MIAERIGPGTTARSSSGQVRAGANAALIFGSQVFAKILSVGVLAILARYLSKAEVGQYAYAIGVAGLLAVFVDLGLDVVVTTMVAEGRYDSLALVGRVVAAKALGFIAACGVLAAVMLHPSFPVQARVVTAVLVAVVVFEMTDRAFGAYFLGRQDARYVAASIAMTALTRLIVCWTLLMLGSRVLGVAVGHLAASVLVLAVMVATWIRPRHAAVAQTSYSGVVGQAFRPAALSAAVPTITSLIARGSPYLLSAIAVAALNRMDVILLGMLRGDVDVGRYVAAARFLDAFVLLSTASGGALLPLLITLASRRDELLSVLRDGLRLLLLCGLPVVFVIVALRQELVGFLFGRAYLESAHYFRGLAPAFALSLVTGVLPSGLIALGRPRLLVLSTTAGVITSVVANLMLTSTFGPVGAAASRSLGEAAVAVVLTMSLAWLAGPGWLVTLFARVGVATAGAAMSFGLAQSQLGSVGVAAVSVLTFLGLGRLLGFARLSDVRVAGSLMRLKRAVLNGHGMP